MVRMRIVNNAYRRTIGEFTICSIGFTKIHNTSKYRVYKSNFKKM